MNTQLPFTPVTPEALSRLTGPEQAAFSAAAAFLAEGQKPPMGMIVVLLETVQRLITERAEERARAAEWRLEAIGELLDSVAAETPEGDVPVVAVSRVWGVIGSKEGTDRG